MLKNPQLTLINQNFRAPTLVELENVGRFDEFMVVKNRSWMIGPQLALNTNWIFTHWMNLFANFSGSILFQDCKCTYRQHNTINGVPGQLTEYSQQNEWKVTPNAETSMGFNFGGYYCQDQYYLNFMIGYSFIVYWNQLKPVSYRDSYRNKGYGISQRIAPPVNHSAVNNDNVVDTAMLYMHGLKTGLEFHF